MTRQNKCRLAKRAIWFAHAFAFLAQIRQLADEDVDEYAEVIGVEVLGCTRCREQEVKDLENQ